MAFDFGFLIAAIVLLYIVAIGYKKKTGEPISTLWKNKKPKVDKYVEDTYQRMYVQRGVK